MKISLDWINQYVDLTGISVHEVAERLTMATAEVEGVEPVNRRLDGVLVATVLDVESLDASQALARVRCGDQHGITVCAAPNLRAGMKSAFAPAGTHLAGGRVVTERTLFGHTSQGILCSSAELDMGGGHFGVLDLPESLSDGMPLADLLPDQDTLLEIDNKSLTHRPDLWGHYGFARELAAILGRDLRPLVLADLDVYDHLPPYPLQVDDAENCPCYGCLAMDGLAARPSPLAIQVRLHALGQRTFGLLVDLTNYVMLELGQPMHAFDGQRLQAVRVAPFGREDVFITLDGQERTLLPEDLLIWNQAEPIALAGIMGGLNSEVGPQTTALLLESANFRAARIRRTATRLALQTDASQRFEKGQPPANVKTAVQRFLHLLQEAGAHAQVRSRFTVAGDLQDQVRRLQIPVDYLTRRIGVPVPQETMVSILRAIGFEAAAGDGVLDVGIPPFRSRKDVAIPADVLEEVTRLFGYDNLEPRLPAIAVSQPVFNRHLAAAHKTRRFLSQAHGFDEIYTYSWFDESWLQNMDYEPGSALTLANPNAEQNVRLQTTLMPNLLAAVHKSVPLRERLRLFELGRAYFPAGDKDHTEVDRLAAVSYQQERISGLDEHFRRVKGTLEALARQLGVPALAFEPGRESSAPWQVPGSFVEVHLNGERVGSLGYLVEPLLEMVAAQSQVVWFELDFGPMEGPAYLETTYVASSRYPGSWFDFSIVADIKAGYADLVRILDCFAHPLLLRREFVTLYTGSGLPEHMGSYTFRYWIESRDHTLSGEEIEAFHRTFTAFLESHGLRLR